jgi:hypothetical protein
MILYGCTNPEEAKPEEVKESLSVKKYLPETTPYNIAMNKISDQNYVEAEKVILEQIKDDLTKSINILSQDKQELMNLYYYVKVKISSDFNTRLNYLRQLKPIANLISQIEIDNLINEDKPLEDEQQKKKNELARNGGISIGMTKEQVYNSSWGHPKKVNRTITANITFEQWVYDNNQYLYFENDKLVTIQTNN